MLPVEGPVGRALDLGAQQVGEVEGVDHDQRLRERRAAGCEQGLGWGSLQDVLGVQSGREPSLCSGGQVWVSESPARGCRRPHFTLSTSAQEAQAPSVSGFVLLQPTRVPCGRRCVAGGVCTTPTTGGPGTRYNSCSTRTGCGGGVPVSYLHGPDGHHTHTEQENAQRHLGEGHHQGKLQPENPPESGPAGPQGP